MPIRARSLAPTLQELIRRTGAATQVKAHRSASDAKRGNRTKLLDAHARRAQYENPRNRRCYGPVFYPSC
jgi:hypothetical protein